MKLSYLDLMTTDPSYNLAMEQYVFDCLPRDRMYFMLWQNAAAAHARGACGASAGSGIPTIGSTPTEKSWWIIAPIFPRAAASEPE